MAAPTPAAVALTQVVRRFGRVTAIDHLTLVIPEGTIFGLLGPNGAGKTTTIRLLLGLLAPDAGQVRVFGLDPVQNGEEVRRQCGVVLDQPGLYDRLTARDNLFLAGRIARMPGTRLAQQVNEVLERVGMQDFANARVGGLSKGMKQRLAIARALLVHPRLFILDEPTSGLDPQAVVWLRELISSLAQEGGRTVVLCTHHLAEAERLCQYVAILRQGRLLAQSSPLELGQGRRREFSLTLRRADAQALGQLPLPPSTQLSPMGGDRWRLVVEEEEAVETVVARLVAMGVGVRAVVPQRTSLEDWYRKAMEAEAGQDG